ncbi:histidinol-phosphate transaminase [Candidatus Magnetomonas plexicatena]|uniref:histidinol-phosphate transaminase n=1 Tax=Candidatus Magnetomonas plexicatena TaxID=2552947 RepID=UPI001C7734A9|nr:histidinol-phosphate transaminase [Nitrospirales bacterium LBB_01]
MIKAPRHITEINPYVPGKPIEELERELGIKGSIKLASNENPLGPSPHAVAEAQKVIASVNRYPDGGSYRLISALSAHLNVRQEEIIIGHGSNELLDIAARTFMLPGDEAVMGHPSFVVYPNSTQKVNGVPVKVALTSDKRHDLRAMADKITPKTKIVFIANPNNPTGTIVTTDEFDAFMDSIRDDILVVIDEAYFEYVTDTMYADSMKHFRGGKTVLILRTFSKIYGLAGLRIGYGVANPKIIAEMNKVREPFNTNSLAQAGAVAALTDTEHVTRSVALNEAGKAFLYEELTKMNLDFTKTHANFIYIDIKKDAKEVYKKMLQKGMIVRPMGENALRVTVGLPKENETFIRIFKEVI